MKIASIGAGSWGMNIVRNLNDLGVLAGVADPDEGLRERVHEAFPGQETFGDYRELIDADLEGVAVATPAPTHYEIAKTFLENGKDVFVEKPMTLTSADAEDLLATAESNGRVLMVGHLLLYQPAVRWLKDYLGGGAIGQVYSMHQERLKLGRARAVENVLWSLGVHDIAVLLYLAGHAPAAVRYSGHAGLREGIEDDTYLHMEFEGGMKAHLHNSWLWTGMLVYDEIAQSVTLHCKSIDEELRNQDEGEEIVFEGSGQPLRLEMEHFIECIRSRETPISGAQNGLEVIRVLESASSG